MRPKIGHRSGEIRVDERISILTRAFAKLGQQAQRAANVLRNAAQAIAGRVRKLGPLVRPSPVPVVVFESEFFVTGRNPIYRTTGIDGTANQILSVIYEDATPLSTLGVTAFGDVVQKFIRRELQCARVVVEVGQPSSSFLEGIREALYSGEEILLPLPSTGHPLELTFVVERFDIHMKLWDCTVVTISGRVTGGVTQP